jgi:hypothetical protein
MGRRQSDKVAVKTDKWDKSRRSLTNGQLWGSLAFCETGFCLLRK